MSKYRISIAFLILSSCLSGLLILEAAMHFLELDYARIWEPDHELGWHHVPGAKRLWTEEGRGFITINSLGQRDRERTVSKPLGTFRIAVYGDSMTEAVQVDLEDTFTSLLEESLKRRGYRVEVLNMGVNGYSPIQELLLLKREGRKYQADLVVLATYLDNDVSGSHPKLNVSQGGVPFFRKEGDSQSFDFTQAQASYDDYHREPLYTLRYYSGLYRWLSAVWWQYKARDVSITGHEVPLRYQFYGQTLNEVWQTAWRLYEQALLEFFAETQRQGSDFLVLSVPAPWVASSAAWDLISRNYPAMRTMPWALEGPEERLRRFAGNRGIRLLTAYPIFGREWSEDPLYWGNLGHMTPRGHRVMADILEKYLLDTQLIPAQFRS